VTSGRTLTAVALVLLVAVVGPAALAAEPPDGLLDGAPHVVRLRPQIAEVQPAAGRINRRTADAATAAVASCDPAQVDALARVPTTERADDAAAACVVLARDDRARDRALLGASRLSGDGIRVVQRHRVGGDRYELVLRTTPRGAALISGTPSEAAALPQTLDVDGRIVGDATLETTASGATTVVVTPPNAKGFSGPQAESLIARIQQARDEQLVVLADGSELTRHARELVADNQTRVDDRDDFNRDCPNPESAATLTLGCYSGTRIYVLRVDQPNLAGVMNVSLAHEMLHAAFDELSRSERREVVDQLEAYMDDTGDPRIEALLLEYERTEPGQRATELHSLIGTQVADLPRALERHYARYFEDRSTVVDAFVGYQSVFDDLQARYDELSLQAASIETQITDTDAAYQAAGAEADRLFEQIQSLRNQGRQDESNALVDAQNAAANRANGLADQHDALVAQYNGLVDEINALAALINESYNAISPVPIELPAG
jgi:hypothetical protein